jgi:hypothetical protein
MEEIEYERPFLIDSRHRNGGKDFDFYVHLADDVQHVTCVTLRWMSFVNDQGINVWSNVFARTAYVVVYMDPFVGGFVQERPRLHNAIAVFHRASESSPVQPVQARLAVRTERVPRVHVRICDDNGRVLSFDSPIHVVLMVTVTIRKNILGK